MRLYSEEYSLYYEKNGDSVSIVEGTHNIGKAIIPGQIDGVMVTKIIKKAFLGCKLLKEVYVPDSVAEIGDFAFALCDHLEVVRLPRGQVKLGQSLFKNDNNLTGIIIGDDENAAHLLAATPILMNADYLVDTVEGGSREWYRMWDQKLIDLLGREDQEGYHLYVLCGEEDLHFDYEQYIDYVQEKKAGLCMLRLLNDLYIDDVTRQKLVDYLNEKVRKRCMLQENHESGNYLPGEGVGTKENSNPVFNYLINHHGNDEIYYELLVNEKIIVRDNQEDLLLLLGDRYPQAKAFLINAFKKNDAQDFFADLEL